MKRLNLLKKRAALRGLFVYKSQTNPAKWGIIDSCGPQGHELSQREAILTAYKASLVSSKVRAYVTDSSGAWHRGSCEKVAPTFATVKKRCKCSRLVV